MEPREAVAWLHRRAGWGLAPGELDQLVDLGVDAVLDRLIDPEGAGLPEAVDPWAEVSVSFDPDGVDRGEVVAVVGAWLRAMATTPRPLEERMRWLWHGHFVSRLAKVRALPLLVGQLRTLGALGLGGATPLVRALTIDPAMLVELDGITNRRGGINENHGRELLELFTVGVDAHDEADVRAAAVALSGWVVDRDEGSARFVARRHDDTPQQLLGVAGVHDVDTVVDAVVGHPACARHLTAVLASELLGQVAPGEVEALARGFRDDGLQVRPQVRRLLEAGLDGRGTELVLAPVPWLIQLLRATGTGLDDLGAPGEVGALLQAAGQVPLAAPNVSGWPSGRAWLTTATTLARQRLAARVAAGAPTDGPAAVAAADGDVDALADALGRPAGLTPATSDAVDRAARQHGPEVALATALSSPDLVIA